MNKEQMHASQTAEMLKIILFLNFRRRHLVWLVHRRALFFILSQTHRNHIVGLYRSKFFSVTLYASKTENVWMVLKY